MSYVLTDSTFPVYLVQLEQDVVALGYLLSIACSAAFSSVWPLG